MTPSRIPSFLAAFFLLTVAPVQVANAQCEADHTIVMADYYFAPSELTILPGETVAFVNVQGCLLYTSPSPRDLSTSRMPSSA